MDDHCRFGALGKAQAHGMRNEFYFNSERLYAKECLQRL
jgi:hypothetical protein